MEMAKKEIFNTQSKFFCQLDEINKIYVFRAFRDKVCLFFLGGGGDLFLMFFPSILFFPFVVLFYSLFCCPLYYLSFVRSFGWLPFQEKGKEYQVNSKIPHMLIACLCNSVSIGQNLQLILHFFLS